MRKTQRNQADNFINLLGRAHGAVKKAIMADKNSIAMDLLEQCQEGAMELGGLIEDAEGEGTKIISLLEDYCELVYQIYEQIRQGRFIAGEEDQELNRSFGGNTERRTAQGITEAADRIYDALCRAMTEIESSLSRDIKVRTEVVFLPYKASMWDSLESVWKAADEDPSCDAYVIPIPYFDKNPDGSFREAHYEADQYPPYVPVTDYNSYDFETRKPDMIFIHNPYDDSNYVTSVHPFFYSGNMKQYTDKLVYIPYFILDEVNPENQNEVESMRHFCTVPGVFHADRVIVQSEAMRQVYIDVLTGEAGESSRKLWEDKILGIGSPKTDKVLNTRRDDMKIPDDWLEIIERPDGSRKKVILYNTGIVGMLAHNEKMIAKLKDVFRVFKEKQDETALLWRPHPLIESTLASMRPHLLEAYLEIRNQYLMEGWGIYDDTADLERAIALSDGYYGDASSVVQLYKDTGKPIMMQNVELTYALQEGVKEA